MQCVIMISNTLHLGHLMNESDTGTALYDEHLAKIIAQAGADALLEMAEIFDMVGFSPFLSVQEELRIAGANKLKNI